MSKGPTRFLTMLAVLGVALACQAGSGTPVPAPLVDEAKTSAPAKETIVLAGGCFWGVQAVFQHVKGVIKATSGYSGGALKNPDYETVSTGTTGHAESVQVVYDPSQITYGELLRIFFSVAHDPTELNRQGPDEGTQYRSVIFYNNDGQKHIAEAYIAQLDQARIYRGKIVTEVVPFKAFYPAEAYHQNYATLHPDNPYIVYNDAPKVANLRREFPDVYTGN
jgi:peptide-methionine (S)-S-oxide reductase